MTIILVFGDSVGAGCWDIEGGWVNRLQKSLYPQSSEQYILVYNCSISGDTSEDVLKRFEQETKVRLDFNEQNVILFAIGANDTLFYHKEQKNEVSPQQFEKNIRKLFLLARKITPHVFTLGLDPCDESRSKPIPWYPQANYENKYIQHYDTILERVATKTGVVFIAQFEKLFKGNYTKRLADCVHLNAIGHKQTFEDVQQVLRKHKIIS